MTEGACLHLRGEIAKQNSSLIATLQAFISQFASDVESFYDAETRRAGVIEAVDRNGLTQMIPLLGVSCGCLVLEADAGPVSMDAISTLLAKLKKTAKAAAQKLAIERLTSFAPA